MLITLSEPNSAHIAEIQRCASDPRVSSTTNVPYPYPPDGAERWMERTMRSLAGKKNLVSVILCDEKFCGLMSINSIDWAMRTAELDYWVAGDFQNRGIGTEAARLGIMKAADSGLAVLFSSCLASNPPSARILLKNGFIELGRFRNDGAFGRKFLGQEMRRFRRDLTPECSTVTDPFCPIYVT